MDTSVRVEPSALRVAQRGAVDVYGVALVAQPTEFKFRTPGALSGRGDWSSRRTSPTARRSVGPGSASAKAA
jgi:hypothetical protein